MNIYMVMCRHPRRHHGARENRTAHKNRTKDRRTDGRTDGRDQPTTRFDSVYRVISSKTMATKSRTRGVRIMQSSPSHPAVVRARAGARIHPSVVVKASSSVCARKIQTMTRARSIDAFHDRTRASRARANDARARTSRTRARGRHHRRRRRAPRRALPRTDSARRDTRSRDTFTSHDSSNVCVHGRGGGGGAHSPRIV